MSKIFLPVCFIIIVIFTACGNPPEDVTTTAAPAFNPPASATNDSSITNQTGANTQALPTVPEKLNTSNSTAKLNPAHGQPGHNCDIEVGAPLNSAPNNIQQATPAAQKISTTQPAPLTKTSGNAKLNPAHGQPGHRCDISVGAPLTSAPQAQQTTAPVTQPKPAATTTPTTSGNAKLNPAHGQPGHDCAIPVGQPLKG